jgi:hypothetical protein
MDCVDITDLVDHIPFTSMATLHNEGKRKRNTVFLRRVASVIVVHLAEYVGFGMGNSKRTEKQDLADLSRRLIAKVIIGKNPLAVKPAEIIKVLPDSLGNNDSLGFFDRGFLLWSRSPAGNDHIDVGIDTRMEGKDHRSVPMPILQLTCVVYHESIDHINPVPLSAEAPP